MKQGMSTGIKILIGAGVLLVLILLWIGGVYNSLVVADENVNQKWADVQTQYQRRADLIPNLVATVKQYTNYEGPLLTEITQARSAWTGAQASGDQAAQVAAAGAMDSAIGRLIVVMENYPDLKANQNFLALQDELAGTENRVQYSRSQFNEVVNAYNQKVRRFPSNIIAGMFGFSVKTPFVADAGSENAPSVKTLFE